MIKKTINISLILSLLFTLSNSVTAKSTIDSIISLSENMVAYDWEVISGVESILQYDNENAMTKNSLKNLNAGNELYSAGVKLMSQKKYDQATEQFSEALKKYKRAKISANAYNYIYINMALSYANTGKEKDKAVASRFLSLVTSKIDKQKEWVYNLAIANYLAGNTSAAIENLSKAIRLDINFFQAYITLEAIYRSNGEDSRADKVRDRLETNEALLIKKMQRSSNKPKRNQSTESNTNEVILAGVKPDVRVIDIVRNDDNLQYNKLSSIKERSMKSVKEGVEAYNKGVNELSKKNPNYQEAIESLKTAEKKLKRGKIKDHGLNFSRANLAIAYLSLEGKEGKSKLGQAKRSLTRLTNKIYYSRDWTYNLAVAHYEYGSRARGSASEVFVKESIKLMKLTIKHDKLFLHPYENLVYIYQEMGDLQKAEKYQKLYNKRRDELLRSFSREEQIKMGIENEHVFRIHLGTFGEYEAPADMFDEKHLIIVPINERQTAYVAEMFYNLEDANRYLKEMIERGYIKAKIIAYKDGEKRDDF